MKIILQIFPPVGLAIHCITRSLELLIRVVEHRGYKCVYDIGVLVLLAIALVRIVPFLRILDIKSNILRVLLELPYPLG